MTTSKSLTPEQKRDLLQGVGKRLAILDEHLLRLIKRRIDLSTLVVDIKGSDPIVVLEREKERITRAGKLAENVGIEPMLAQSVLHTIINGGVKHQTMIRDQITSNPNGSNPGDRSPEALRRNLLLLTEQVASTYDEHQHACPATEFTYKIEDRMIHDAITQLVHRGTLLDLGTATGRMVFAHKAGFRSVVGYDVSPAMIACANEKARAVTHNGLHFEVVDLEAGIPQEDQSVSFIIMNNGTCGDIRDFSSLLNEIERVLVPGGLAYLSFYNRDTLVHQSLLPWQNSVAAIFNPVLNTLEVDLDGVRGTIPIYAQAYSVADVQALIERKLVVRTLTTFPFVTSLMPRELFSEGMLDSLLELDERLSESGDEHGAYISVIAQKC